MTVAFAWHELRDWIALGVAAVAAAAHWFSAPWPPKRSSNHDEKTDVN